MKNYLKMSKGVTSKDKFNSAAALNLKDFGGKTLHVNAGALYETEEGGNKKICGFIVVDGGENSDARVIISTISKTAVDSIDALIDYMDENGAPTDVFVDMKMSNGGREYIMLSLV